MPEAVARPLKPAAATADRPDAQVAEAIGRMLFDREYRASNPGETPEAKRQAWVLAKSEYMKVGRYLAGRLQKAGFAIVGPAER
jgi:hypothetical protein